MVRQLFTIGHSNLTIEAFIELLQLHQITAVADVRSRPYSRYLPHFNKAEVKTALLKNGIQYVFLGQELGARTDDLSCYDLTGKALYDRIAKTALFSEGIQRLLKGIEQYKIALMCAEKDPMTCHRTILVCRNLKPFNLQINHILSDGTLETHEQLEERLLSKFHKGKDINQPLQLSLFEVAPPPPEINLEDAYHRQGLEIAYVNKENP